MPELSGSFSGSVGLLSDVAVTDQANHRVGLAEISGSQKSPDPLWDNSTITYWGVTDMVGAQGTQHGYYVNTHTDGDKDIGTFEGKVSMAGGQLAVEGSFKITGGSGKLKGITGGGKFKTKMKSPTELDCTWQGNYELAGAKAAGR